MRVVLGPAPSLVFWCSHRRESRVFKGKEVEILHFPPELTHSSRHCLGEWGGMGQLLRAGAERGSDTGGNLQGILLFVLPLCPCQRGPCVNQGWGDCDTSQEGTRSGHNPTCSLEKTPEPRFALRTCSRRNRSTIIRGLWNRPKSISKFHSKRHKFHFTPLADWLHQTFFSPRKAGKCCLSLGNITMLLPVSFPVTAHVKDKHLHS